MLLRLFLPAPVFPGRPGRMFDPNDSLRNGWLRPRRCSTDGKQPQHRLLVGDNLLLPAYPKLRIGCLYPIPARCDVGKVVPEWTD